jgi:anti-sigma-K factor RskA
MDIQTLIQSGLLEQYVLGHCSAEERALVERMAAAHPEIRAEITSIEQALERFAFLQAVPPPPGTKEQILARIERETIEPTTNKTTNRSALGLFGIVVFALLAGLSYLLLQQKNLKSSKKYIEYVADSLRAELKTLDERVQKAEPFAALICDPETRRIVLLCEKGQHSLVYYNPRSGIVAFDPSTMPAMPAGRYCQFWAIVDGKPVSLGMAEQAKNICETMQKVANPQAFAFSEEDNPAGNPVPTKVVAISPAG